METLQGRIRAGEHTRQDFKFRIDDQRKIARTLCAFANTEGGSLLIGVKDNGKVAGCDPQEEFHMIEGAATMFCFPPVKIESKIWQEDFRLVLEISIPLNNPPIHKANDEQGKRRAYIRVGDQTVVANKITEGVWREKVRIGARPLAFEKAQLELLEIIRNQELTSLSKLYRHSTLSMKEIDRLLVQLICWDVLNEIYTSEGFRYALVKD
jgi:predicted HTH transcriptional regulator